MTKIFAIGFQKTGTTSLAYACDVLGFKLGNAATRIHRLQKRGLLTKEDPQLSEKIRDAVVSMARRRDGVQDSPSAFFYRELDEKFPGSKFILTYRDPDKWVKSLTSHFPEGTNLLRSWMYGVDTVTGNEEILKDVYIKKTEEIRTYFAGRDDYLELNLQNGDGWYELINFLGKETVQGFPKLNTKTNRTRDQSKGGSNPNAKTKGKAKARP